MFAVRDVAIEGAHVDLLVDVHVDVHQEIGRRVGALETTGTQVPVHLFANAVGEERIVVEARITGRERVGWTPRVRVIALQYRPALQVGIDGHRRAGTEGDQSRGKDETDRDRAEYRAHESP